jgi:hypothetical protein
VAAARSQPRRVRRVEEGKDGAQQVSGEVRKLRWT